MIRMASSAWEAAGGRIARGGAVPSRWVFEGQTVTAATATAIIGSNANASQLIRPLGGDRGAAEQWRLRALQRFIAGELGGHNVDQFRRAFSIQPHRHRGIAFQ